MRRARDEGADLCFGGADGAGLGVCFGDLDDDGRPDLYVANDLMPNYLFRNRGDGAFDDVTLEAQVNLGRWAWGSMFADINNDGLEDLLVANGFITTEDTGDL